MKKFKVVPLLVICTLVLAACNTTDPAESEDLVFPAYLDDNANSINDYVEEATHDGGASTSLNRTALHSEVVPGAGPRHPFLDENGDGICDHAQDGTSTWHGPGYIDSNGNDICDYWDSTHPLYENHTGMHFNDSNGNGLNDFFGENGHIGNGHDFLDNNDDGICDYAQDGSPSWHGPGFQDSNKNGISDPWEPGGRGHGGIMHGTLGMV